jgi:hypothetical protein
MATPKFTGAAKRQHMAEKSQKASQPPHDILWWVEAATWIGITSISVRMAIAAV